MYVCMYDMYVWMYKKYILITWYVKYFIIHL